MKRVPLPEPVYMITLTRGTAWSRRAAVHALRIALWAAPVITVEELFIRAGHHSRWLAMAAAYLTLAIAVLVVNVRAGGEQP